MEPEHFFSDKQLRAYRIVSDSGVLNTEEFPAAELNRAGVDDMTLLAFAILVEDPNAIIGLMRAGADPNQIVPDVGSPAIMAITKHFNPPTIKAISALLEGGYDPNQLLGEGTPYLFFFVDYRHWPGLSLSLQRGGDMNAHRRDGESLLAYLIEGGHYAFAKKLISAGANVAASGGGRKETALEAIEYQLSEANPKARESWTEMLEMRHLLLSKLKGDEDRRSAFTDKVAQMIRDNP